MSLAASSLLRAVQIRILSQASCNLHTNLAVYERPAENGQSTPAPSRDILEQTYGKSQEGSFAGHTRKCAHKQERSHQFGCIAFIHVVPNVRFPKKSINIEFPKVLYWGGRHWQDRGYTVASLQLCISFPSKQTLISACTEESVLDFKHLDSSDKKPDDVPCLGSH